VLAKQDVVIGLGVERRVEVHKIDGLGGDVTPQHVEVVAVVEGVRVAPGLSTDALGQLALQALGHRPGRGEGEEAPDPGLDDFKAASRPLIAELDA